MAKDARIRDQEDQDQNESGYNALSKILKQNYTYLRDEPDHGKPPASPLTPTREPPKSILKASRVTFPEGDGIVSSTPYTKDEEVHSDFLFRNKIYFL